MSPDTLAALKVSLIAVPTMFVVTSLFIVACTLLLKVFPAQESRTEREKRAAA